jgi:2-hydroxychromene-2-carboxylate isomerase
VARVTFFFDVGSPYAWLAAERVDAVLPVTVRWQPVLLGGLFRSAGRGSWGVTEDREAGMAEVSRRARERGLPAVRWPEPWPGDYLFAMRATTYAFSAGRGRAFTLAAFRAAFGGGVDLGRTENVVALGRAVGLDPAELEAAAVDRAVKGALRSATDTAFALGVFGVPTVAVDDALFWGDDRLEDAAEHLRGRAG